MNKRNNKYEPFYSFDTKVPFKKLIKGSLLINFAPLLIIAIFVINGGLQAPLAIGLGVAIFMLSLLFIYPYLADLQELTSYVHGLTSNKKVQKPELSFLNNVEELSKEIEVLNKRWRQKNKKLKKNLKEEIKTQQMLQDFVANASHEMKTPLASIKGFTETLMDMGQKTNDEARFLLIIKEQSERLENLIKELLILSKLENEQVGKKELVNLKEIPKLIETNLSILIKENKAKLSYKTPKSLPRFKARKLDLVRAIENLVSNAIRYNKKGVHVSINISNTSRLGKKFKVKHDTPKYIKISIKDNGIGIDKKEIPRLTERFYRVDKARSRKVGGSGLGLAIVNQVAKGHGGFLDIKSELKKGSEFSIYLPVNED